MKEHKPKTLMLSDLKDFTFDQVIQLWTFDDEFPFGYNKLVWTGDIETMYRDNPNIDFEHSEIQRFHTSTEYMDEFLDEYSSCLAVECWINYKDDDNDED